MPEECDHDKDFDHHKAYVEAIDPDTGDMLWRCRHRYTTLYFVELVKYEEDGMTYVIQSTAESNNAGSRHPSFVYYWMEVWSAETLPGLTTQASTPACDAAGGRV